MLRRTSLIVFLGLIGGCFSGPAPVGPGEPPQARTIEALVEAPRNPPPITGGTLTLSSDGELAYAADPDRGLVWVANLTDGELIGSIAFDQDAQPFRIVEDSDGGIFVSLRETGQVAHIKRGELTVDFLKPVCQLPRGLAFDAATNSVWVACFEGRVVSFPASGGPTDKSFNLEHGDGDGRGLRDIIVSEGQLLVTRFREAEVLVLDAGVGTINARHPLPGSFDRDAVVAWRMVPKPGGGAMVVHQRALNFEVAVETPGGYGSASFSPCGGSIVDTAVTSIAPDGTPVGTRVMPDAVMPVDVAVAGSSIRVASAGTLNDPVQNQTSGTSHHSVLFETTRDMESADPDGFDCGRGGLGGMEFNDRSQVVAVAAFARGSSVTTVIQTRDPWTIRTSNGTLVELPGESMKDSGHDLFHEDAGGGIACASCHAEGADDSHTWEFSSLGPRRTQDVRGGILGTEPFHWTGDMADFNTLVNEVFVARMGGPDLPDSHSDALAHYIDKLEAPAPLLDMDDEAVQRGHDLFFSSQTECGTCHNGDRLSNNDTTNVGTIDLQVPSLVGVVWRAPYMHTGCATNLRARFTECGGGDQHGRTSHLNEGELSDLVAFMESL